MTRVRSALIALAVYAVLFVPCTSFAQATWEPFDGVTKLVAWFTKLNDQFDQVVAVEKRGQLVRKVDRLRKDLYALEADTRILLDNIPSNVPSADQRQQLLQLTTELMQSVQRLGITARDVGADLRLNNGSEVEEALTYGLKTRALALTYLQRAIEGSASGIWDAAEARQRLERGLQAVKDAQIAVTVFRNRLG
jgi:hypothetical protein